MTPADSGPAAPARPGRHARPEAGILASMRGAAIAATGVLVTAASAASFAESYRGLWLWARHHGLAGFWAAAFPLQVDAFIMVGELVLLVAVIDRWPARSRILPWAVTLAGLAVSVAGNVGHVAGTSVTNRATAAVPPLAASVAMAVGLAVLKRVVSSRRFPAGAPELEAEALPAIPAADAGAPRQPAPAALGPAPRRVARPGGKAGSGGKAIRQIAVPDVTAAEVAEHFRSEISAGQVPSQAAIRAKWHVGSDRARRLREEVTVLAADSPAR